MSRYVPNRHLPLAVILSLAIVSLILLGGLLRQPSVSAADGPESGRSTIPTRTVSLRAPRSPGGSAIEFRGLIQEVDELYWIVSGRVVLLTESTFVRGRPQIGALAEVKGMYLFGDIVLARSIEVTVPGAYDQVEFEGTLESIAQDVWVVGGVTVTISPVTVVQGTPALGMHSEVQGVLQPDGSVLAERVTIRGPSSAPRIDVAGLVERIESTYWIVAGTTVFVDEHTFIDDSRAPAEAGMWAQIRAARREDGSWLAVRIRLSRPN